MPAMRYVGVYCLVFHGVSLKEEGGHLPWHPAIKMDGFQGIVWNSCSCLPLDIYDHYFLHFVVSQVWIWHIWKLGPEICCGLSFHIKSNMGWCVDNGLYVNTSYWSNSIITKTCWSNSIMTYSCDKIRSVELPLWNHVFFLCFFPRLHFFGHCCHRTLPHHCIVMSLKGYLNKKWKFTHHLVVVT